MLFLLDINRDILEADAFLKCNADCISNVSIILKANCISIEFCRTSSSCQFNIIVPENFIRPNTVSLRCNNASECALDLDHENNVVRLNYDICHSELKLNGNDSYFPLEIRFQFQIINKDVIEKYILKNCDSSVMSFKDIMYDKYKTIETCKIICTMCGSLLTENFMKFESVHKYYDWKSELEETSFCHKHDNDSDTSGSKANSLYIDDMYLYFHHSLLLNFKLLEKKKTYKCIECCSILSFQKKMDNLQYIGFFSDKIMLVKSLNDEHDLEVYKINACMLSFSSIIQELLKTAESTGNIKLYLQSKVDEKTDVLLLWINSKKLVQCLLQESNENKVSYQLELKGKEVFKVHYFSTSSDSEVSKKWKHNFNVEFFQISDNMMNVVKEFLQKSSDCYSERQDSVKGFRFGYLPAEVELLSV